MSDAASTIPLFVRDDIARLGLEFPDELLVKLANYLDHLLESNRKFNLTGVKDRDEAWRRHIVDSMTVLPWLDELDEGAKVIDVGSGGGLPGVVIAIARPDLSLTLLESTGKKAKFLESCKESVGFSNISVLNTRAETAGQDTNYREQFSAATCRALGPMNEILEYTLPLIKVEGRLLAMKGPSAEDELRDAGDALSVLGGGDLDVFDAYPEGFDFNTVIVSIRKERPTPEDYPRLPGMPRQSPL